MKFYGKQRYKMAEAALAYANNHLDGDKARIRNNRVVILRNGRWQDVGDVRNFADKWHALNPPDPQP